ncbi:rhomboid family intramembrane serine protease [Celeribacter marinus]|uniref:rhomboid family intramembrane serine protease n=1 Tax=Celeribacter marinus TaxID=1397108 RepID=UPI003174FA01
MSDHSDDHEYTPESPFNALPPAVVLLAVVIGGIELLFQIGSYGIVGGPDAIGWRITAMEQFAFFDTVFDAMRDQGIWPFEHVQRLVTYAFVHHSFTHAAMVVVFILALGKMVGETFGNIAVLVVFFVSVVAGALAYGLFLDTSTPLVGAYSGAYGLIGSYTLMLWIGLGAMKQNQIRAFTLIGFLLAIQLIFGLLFGATPDWLADIAGFIMGFGVSILLVPGAPHRILARIRKR